MDKVAQIDAPISNYYGGPGLSVYRDGTARLDIENYDGWRETGGRPVSKQFAVAFIREFGGGTPKAQAALAVMEREGEAKPVAFVTPEVMARLRQGKAANHVDLSALRGNVFTEPLYASPSPEAPSYTSDRVFDGVRSMSPEAAAAHVERVKRVMGEREGKPVGLFANLTPEQQAAALAYRGPENLMPSRPEAYIKGAIADLRHAYNHMVNDRVKDIEALARGLIGPAIERLEQAITAET